MNRNSFLDMKTVHLFNCDNLYPLGSVEDLLHEVEQELPFKLHIERHIFRLPDLRKTSEEVKSMEMDYAVFVVHANESRLSINEKDAGIGYACVFKELLERTGGKVLVVIGGDTYYKGEENRGVISEWAKYKIFSQFPAESMDGRKSFVFSWNKKHNPIHYDATKHFFENDGREFDARHWVPQATHEFHDDIGEKLEEVISGNNEGFVSTPPALAPRWNYGTREPVPSPPREDWFRRYKYPLWIIGGIIIIFIIIMLAIYG